MPTPAPKTGNSGRRPRPRPRKARQSRRTATRPTATPAQTYERELEAALDNAATIETKPMSFAELGLPDRLVQALAQRGVVEPFAIQTRTLPDALAGQDILGRAQTGSGKTLAFGIPLLARLASGSRTGDPRGLVLVPTRELAQQVTDALAPLARRIGLKVTSVYGGASMRKQINALRSGVDVVIATPGRLIDLQEQGECALDEVVISVVDEADHMADLGFLPPVTQILDMTAAGGQRMLFSATLDRGVSGLVRRYLVDPAFHAVAAAAAPIDSVEHKAFVVRYDDKVAVAAEIAARPGRTLFFVRTKRGADRLAVQLGRAGVEAAAIHGDLRQGARRRALDGFASGSPRVLVATDVAARGIHVDDVDLVVHFDPTDDPKDYLHRSGRTARAGATGTVVSLALPDQRRPLSFMLEQAKVRVEQVNVQPGHEAVREVATSGTPIVVVSKPARRTDNRRNDKHRNDKHRTDRHRDGNSPGDQFRTDNRRTGNRRTDKKPAGRGGFNGREARNNNYRPARQRRAA